MNLKNALKPVAGVLIVALIIYFVDVGKVAAAFAQSDPLLIGLAFLLTPVSMILRFIRWDRIIRLAGMRLSMVANAKIYMFGFFFGTITPSKIGDLLKFRYLNSEHGINKGTALSMAVLDHVFDLIVVIAVGAAALPIAYNSGSAASVALVVVLLAVMLYVMFSRRLFRKLSDFFVSKFSIVQRLMGIKGDAKKEGVFESLYKPFGALRSSPSSFASIFILSIVIWLSVGLQAQLTFMAMGIRLEFFSMFAMLCLATLVSLLPISISGLGTREAAMVLLFSMFGVAADKTIAMSLIYFVMCQISVAVVGGLMYAASVRKNIKEDKSG